LERDDASVDVIVNSVSVTNLRNKLPLEYWEFEDVFFTELAGTITSYYDYNYTINLVPGEVAPYLPIYNLSRKELDLLKEYLNSTLKKG